MNVCSLFYTSKMSILIVKNLPRSITEDYVKEMFETKGTVTNLQFKYCPKTGHFRRFAFVGFKTEEQARSAMEFFDGTFLRTCKIKVETCVNMGDPNKPRAWSKYSKDSSAYQKSHPETKVEKKTSKKEKEEINKAESQNKAKSYLYDVLSKYKDDPKFAEFLEVHKNEKVVWNNDGDAMDVKNSTDGHAKDKNKKLMKNGSENIDTSDDNEDANNGNDSQPVFKKSISDFDYLRSKMKKDHSKTTNDEENENECIIETRNVVQNDYKNQLEKQKKIMDFTVKLRGIPVMCKKGIIKKFFEPLKIRRLKQPPKLRDVAFVQFCSEQDVKQALKKHRGFLDGRRVFVTRYQLTVNKEPEHDEKFLHWKKLTVDLEQNHESIAESGQLFVRNLSYTVTEEDLENLFQKYGPLVEVRLPIERYTQKPKGFAFVVFLIPEHAVKAYSKLDGTSFQGRVLHIIPGKSKPNEEHEATEGSSYKTKKAAMDKAQSGSSHNWNTLFLGADAVANVVAEKYNTTKQDLLNPESSESVAVRMALGETQIVIETRKFLIDHGVQLDAFSQPATKRSKTVILVKNLPVDTSEDELEAIFKKYGEVGRVVFPPSGITAVVEFLQPTDARRAFKNLAYTRFHETPLYLEWAPVQVFSNQPIPAVMSKGHSDESEPATEDNQNMNRDDTKVSKKEEEEEEEEAEDEAPEADTVLFVKNLNFSTGEESLRKVFETCGKLHSVMVAKKKDLKNSGEFLSLGYGFVQFKRKVDANKALKQLQHTTIDDHVIELKMSNRTISSENIPKKSKTSSKSGVQKSTKILVRNIPFEATQQEVEKLFRTFGEIKTIRLPKKAIGKEKHRGFGFVDFVTRSDAKRAFEALCHSTHLYGRRLVLEWAADDDQDVETLRKRTARYFHEGVPAPKKLRKAAILEQLGAAPSNDL